MIFRPGHSLLNGLLALLIAWLVGLALFVQDALSFPEGKLDNAPKADGIVVLTGGTARMEAGYDLLAGNAAPKLLVSGIDPRADTKKLVPASHPARKKLNCCITFGPTAADTYGNAREAAAWAEHEKMKSLLVVTSHYHMRRSLFEFHLAMPEVELKPYALVPGQVRLSEWWNYPGTASLLMSEYTKLLLAYARAPLHKLFGNNPG
jgi:uncharacterized SAM-binding protein YcdF (DUF218 family)